MLGKIRNDGKIDILLQDSLAEWSKALAPGASPQGLGIEPHSCHFLDSEPISSVPRPEDQKREPYHQTKQLVIAGGTSAFLRLEVTVWSYFAAIGLRHRDIIGGNILH